MNVARRIRPSTCLGVLCLLLCLAVPLDGLAADLRVAIGDLAGRGTGRKTLIKWQRALKKLGGIRIQSTGDFKKQARAMQAEDIIPQDARALSDVAAVLEVDVVVYGSVVRADQRTWPGSGGNDRVMLVSIYSGKDGRFIAEEIVEVPRGRLSNSVWRKAAVAVEPYLGEAAVEAPPEPMRFDSVPVDPDPRPRADVRERTETPEDYTPGGGRYPLLRLHGGLALLSRDFDYATTPESPLFAEGGIQYASAIVPGLAIDIEGYPLASVLDGAARGLGLGLRFEKVFLETEQTVTGPDGEQVVTTLETSHSHVLPRLLYRYVFGGGTEVVGHIGLGFLGFEIQENPEYNGVSYTYLTVGAGGHIPLGSPMMAVDLRAAILPYVGVGDSVDELGAEASSFGYRLYGGVASVVGDISLQIGIEYTGISAEISGEGRGGRQGTTADDRYVGARLMGGYRF